MCWPLPTIGGVLLVLAVCAAADGGAQTSPPPFVPAFTLEQAVQVRTIGQVALSRDGRTAAFGLAGHYFGFPVVPRFGHDNNLRIVSLDTGELRQATSGPAEKTAPVFSPSGELLAFESEDDVWVVRLRDGRPTRVTTNRARDSRAFWSPDGQRVGFLSNRDGGTDIWLASVDGERHGLTRLTSDGMTKTAPQWAPDGSSIVYAAKGPLDFYAQGIFTIAATGGSPRRLTPPDEFEHSQPHWSPDGRRLAFVSDRTGYAHVWTMNADGSDPRHFDTGPYDSVSPHFDVRPVWSSDGQKILTTRNTAGRFELVSVAVGDASLTVLGSGPGQYHEAGWRHDGQPVYVYENAWSPPDLYAGAADGARRQLSFSSHVTFRESHTARVERVRFASTGGLEVQGFVLTPRQPAAGTRLPAIVALHPNGDGQFYDHWNPFFHYLAQSGYALLLLDQRGSSGYGRAFRKAQIGNWGTGTFDDVKAAAAFVKALPDVDPARVGVMGLSFGGYQTLLALTKTPDLFRAGVDLMGPTDRRGRSGDQYRELQIGARQEDDPALYDRISPITSVSALRAPLLIIHSDQDRNVPPEETYRLIDELQRQHKYYDAVIYPGEAHGLANPEHQLDSYRRMLQFFDRWLKR